MTEKPDLPSEMIRLLDDDTVEAILAGEANGSVPAEFARVAELARAARVNAVGAEPATSEQEQEHDTELIAAIATAVRRGSAWNATDDNATDSHATGNVVPLRRRRHGRAAAAVAFAAMTFSATAAAAATNHLPASLQNALSNAASHVGVHLPEADAHSDQPASTPPVTGEVPQHDETPTSSAPASDAAPPAVTPASDAANSAHDHEPGDTASAAHSDNPSSEDDTHARSGEDNGRTPTTQSSTDSTQSSDTSSSGGGGNGSGSGSGSDHGGSSNSTHSDVGKSNTRLTP